MTTDLPPGWVWATLGDLGRYHNGRAFKSADWGEAGRPIIRIQNLTGSGSKYNHFDGQVDPRHVVSRGDLLVSWAATLGVYVWRGPEAVLNQHIFKVESHISPQFHRWLLESVVTDLYRQSHGSGMVHITKKKFEQTPVRLPPPAEQGRIVTAIEEHFSRLDAIEAGVAAVQAKCTALPSIAMAQLFSPEWPTSRLDAVAHVGSGATPKRSEGKYWSHGTIPWVTSGAVNELSIWSAEEFISERALAETSVKLWPAGTVLMAMYGEGKTRGRAAVLEFESTCNQACAAINFDRSLLDGRFLRTFLNVQYETNRRLSSGGVQPNLNLGLVKAMEIPIPCLETQASVANQAHEIVSASDELLDVCRTARQRVSALRRSILADAFAGRLVPRQPHDYSASDLMASA